ncbi:MULTISPECIES: DUF1842 domain-containing protein [unclassified Pseudomonas]|uniref:DUF1842 domain-containing protein n=1 Tax=unclassified Pseudomonas TaxID=196821 RepID=UPI00215FCCBE|nr:MULTISPECIES: DUF1842 domain-containing protein [unclassified Pseudomonas]UVM48240.1 DUF1842 domain-containing protein [Pseudomonas sp. B21-015]WPN55916.1 DUF1842 domain-containing protein [Pseudomonas sp. P9_31]
MSGSTQQLVGLFPLSYRIGTSAPGAQSLALNILVFTPDETVNGTAAITQATNPPLDVHSDVWGEYTYLTVMSPGVSKILITAQGNQGGPGSNSIVNFKLQLVVGTDWKEGVANYSYLNGQQWVEVNNAPAHLVDSVPSNVSALPPLEPGPVIPPQSSYPPIMPLYAAPIQSAMASGDLAQMKNLARLAQQQLDQQPQLTSALEVAKGEISRQERR